MISRICSSAAAFLFSYAIIHILINWFGFTRSLTKFPTLGFIILALLFTAYVAIRPRWRMVGAPWLALAMLLLGVITLVPFAFVYDVFGTYDLGSIMITMRNNPPKEMLFVGLGTLSDMIIEYTIIFFVLVLFGFYLSKRVPYFAHFAVLLGAFLVFASPLTTFLYRSFVPNPHHELVDISEDFQIPQIISRPDEHKNIIFMYLESVERTYRDIPETTAAFASLAQIESAGLSFDNIHQIYGTHFTAAGMLATQCGIPLLPNGIINVARKLRGRTESEELDFEGFMNHVVCLGDILAQDGYIGSYVNGSNLAVFNKGSLFQSHGHERVFGVDVLDGPREEVYENNWGLSDATVFQYAQDELEYLVSLDRPFTMSLLTLSTHGPDAELDPGCDYPLIDDSRIPAAIKCTGDHVVRMLEKLDELGIADNTIVVVLSDHLAMRSSISHVLKARDQDRRNLVTVLGAGAPLVISEEGTMLDVYPTILKLMGYEIADSRANMGVSLLSEHSTLAQRVGVTKLSKAIKQNTALQDFLWNEEVFNSVLDFAAN
jgi:phosphoglycerol transferase